MAASTTIFVLLGITAVTANLMKVITYLDQPRRKTLLKVLLSNDCMYDCKYCVNRRTNETRRATFTPEELADLTIQFYRRNYIEGLFLSSGVLRSPDYTTELMIRALSILRREYRFNEIADMLGFSTQSHFSYCFKQQFGMSPREYASRS